MGLDILVVLVYEKQFINAKYNYNPNFYAPNYTFRPFSSLEMSHLEKSQLRETKILDYYISIIDKLIYNFE